MKSILFSVAGFNIYGYGLMIAIGIVIAVWLFMKRTKERGYNEDHILNMIIITIIFGRLGGKVFYILTDFKYIASNPSIIIEQFGYGFVIYGAIIFGIVSVFLYSKKKKWSTLEVFDLLVPEVALAQGFGRIGCLLAGCCYGAITNGPLYIVFPYGGLAPAGEHLYPTQVYSFIFDFLLSVFLFWYSKKKSKKLGDTTSMYLIIYSIGRFLVEFLRNDPRGEIGILSTSQFISIFILIAGVLLLNRDKLKGRKSRSEY